MNENENIQDVEVNIELQPVEIEKYDNTQHVGKKVKIGKISIHATDRFKDRGTVHYLRVESEVLDTIITGKDKKQTEIKASRIFSLQEDSEGKIGWAESSQLKEFLSSMKVSTPNELVGKEIIVLLTDEKKGVRFCTF